MDYIVEYKMWTSSTSDDDKVHRGKGEDESGVHFTYKSDDKVYHGVEIVHITNPVNDKSLGVRAKFDSGAHSSSLDIKVARALGVNEELLKKCIELNSIKVPRTAKLKEQNKIADGIESGIKKDFQEVTKVRIIRSSTGFTVRIFINLILEINGNSVITSVNLRDRSGLSTVMLIGLSDM